VPKFKTGVAGPGDNTFIKHALRTLALKPWKAGRLDCPVIHVYVANAVNIKASDFKSCLASAGTGAKDWDRSRLRDNVICVIWIERAQEMSSVRLSILFWGG
jgi:hypothetical protein